MTVLLTPIEGNGWYFGNERIDPPEPFWVDQDSMDREGVIYGDINDCSCQFNGYGITASPRYLIDKGWLNVEIRRAYKSSFETDKEQSVVFGYAKIDKIQ